MGHLPQLWQKNIILVPEHGRVIQEKFGMELALAQVKGRFEHFRWTNQIMIREDEHCIKLFQLLVDGYMREMLAAVLGVYIHICRIGKYWQQAFMYGVKIKPGFERFFDPKFRLPEQPYFFDIARQLAMYNGNDGGNNAGPSETVFSHVDSGGILGQI